MDQQEIVVEFLIESAENLARFEQEMVALEQRPNDPGLLASIFRTIHTIKGTCGFLGLPRLESVAHASENVLGRIRDKTPYSSGDRMMLSQQGAGWMIEGSPPRLLRDYNQLIDAYNRGARI